jgi:deoxycytidylate deaminase
MPDYSNEFRVLYQNAWELSGDPKTKTAAGLLKRCGEGLSVVGVNHLPKGFEPTPENLDNKVKDQLIIHAEEDVILECAQDGMSTYGRTMIACWAPCLVCARLIIGAGITKLIVHKEMHDRTYEKYRDGIAEAVRRLGQAGVVYEMWSGKVGDYKRLMNNENWEP